MDVDGIKVVDKQTAKKQLYAKRALREFSGWLDATKTLDAAE